MANREIFPGGIYPLEGDVESTAGLPTVKVVGIQGTLVQPPDFGIPIDRSTLVFHEDVNAYVEEVLPFNRSIQVNSNQISDDYDVTVNAPKPITVNGV